MHGGHRPAPGFDRLAQLVKSKLGEDPQAASLFVFANRNATRLKARWFDHNGYCPLYKRLHRAHAMRDGNVDRGKRAAG